MAASSTLILPALWRRCGQLLAALALGAAAHTSWAQAPMASLSLVFSQPSGTVDAEDSIPVMIRFTNTDATLPFVVDNSLPDGGLAPDILPAGGYYYDPISETQVFAPFVSYTDFNLSIGFGCSGTFTSECTSGPPYTFEFAANPFGTPFSLAAGASFDYLFGTFVPSAGPVPAGSYEFYRSVLWLNVTGLDADGHVLSAVVFPAATCFGDSAEACAGASIFTRTVVEVPEPASLALLAGGLAVVGWRVRRRRGMQ